MASDPSRIIITDVPRRTEITARETSTADFTQFGQHERRAGTLAESACRSVGALKPGGPKRFAANWQ